MLQGRRNFMSDYASTTISANPRLLKVSLLALGLWGALWGAMPAAWADDATTPSAAILDAEAQAAQHATAVSESSAAAAQTPATNAGPAATEIYRSRQGKYDVSVMVDHAQAHKLSPQEQAILDADLKKRQEQERATFEALNNPQSSQQYVQDLSNPAPQNPQNASGEPADIFDQALVVDMVVSQQNLQLNVLNSPSAPAPFTLATISLERPQALQESFILAGNKMVLAYGDEKGTFAITYTLSPVSLEQQADFQNYAQFKQALTQRFSDKDNLLYGEYQILDQQDFPGRKELTLKGFLKKPSDGILPEMQNYFYERTVLDKGYLATISCEFRGNQAQAVLTSQRAERLADFCLRVLRSYQYQFKTAYEQ